MQNYNTLLSDRRDYVNNFDDATGNFDDRVGLFDGESSVFSNVDAQLFASAQQMTIQLDHLAGQRIVCST